MKPKFAHLLIAIAALLAVPLTLHAQTITSLNATAKGQGTLTISDSEEHKITSVVVRLREGGEAEMILITDLQLFVQGHWTAPEDISKGISLKIKGGVVSGNATGSGTLFLRSDSKSIDKLRFDATGTGNTKITVEFTAASDNPI